MTACLVIALKVTRSTCLGSAFFFASSSLTCQLIASPSRSGSVARIRRSAFLASSAIVLHPLRLVAHRFPNPSRSPRPGRPSRPWAAGRGRGRRRPRTLKSPPRYFSMVFALAGDSTMTSCMEFFAGPYTYVRARVVARRSHSSSDEMRAAGVKSPAARICHSKAPLASRRLSMPKIATPIAAAKAL